MLGSGDPAHQGQLVAAAPCAACGQAASLPHMNCANIDCNKLFLACDCHKVGFTVCFACIACMFGCLLGSGLLDKPPPKDCHRADSCWTHALHVSNGCLITDHPMAPSTPPSPPLMTDKPLATIRRPSVSCFWTQPVYLTLPVLLMPGQPADGC